MRVFQFYTASLRDTPASVETTAAASMHDVFVITPLLLNPHPLEAGVPSNSLHGLELLILLPPSPEYWIIDGAVHGAELDTHELCP